MKTLLLGEETELEMPTKQPAAGNASLQHACHKLGPLEFSTPSLSLPPPIQGDRFLHHSRIARNFPQSVHEMLVFGDRDAKGCHCQPGY